MFKGGMNYEGRPTELLSHEQVVRDVEIVRSMHQEDRINVEEFINEEKPGYGARDILADQKMVATMEEKFKKRSEAFTESENKKIEEREHLSEALEIAVIVGGQKAKWFGENTHLVRSSRYDDIFNGVDGILEFDMGEEAPFRIALAIDASMSGDLSIIEDKMARGIKKIENDQVEVKYFKSAIDDFKGKLTAVLPIVLGIEARNAQKLVHLFAGAQRAEGNPDKLKKMEKLLAEDPSQIIFLKELLAQLDMYARMFSRRGSRIQYTIAKVHGLIDLIVDKKEHIDSDETENKDQVFGLIKSVAAKKAMEYQRR